MKTQGLSRICQVSLSVIASLAAGAAILFLEVVSPRLLAPTFGGSIYLWSTLLAVALGAMSCGCVVGGLVASAKSPQVCSQGLGWLLIIGGVLASVPGLYGHWVVDQFGGVDLRWGIALSSLVLFGPPIACLGMIGPMAFGALRETNKEHCRVVGWLGAFSAVGSVLGAFVTGFVLIPYYEIVALLLCVGGILAVGGLIFLIAAGVCNRTSLQVAVLVACFLCQIVVGRDTKQGIRRASAYGDIAVVEEREVRALLVDGIWQTAIQTDTGESALAYAHVMAMPVLGGAVRGKALVLGLGGGCLARMLIDGGWDVDAVEVDPAMVAVAREYFGFKSDQVHIDDARRYVRRCAKTYDAILVDVYGGGIMPFHLTTKEFFAEVRRVLSPTGVVVVNAIVERWDSALLQALAGSAMENFAFVECLPVGLPDVGGNVILYCGGAPLVVAPVSTWATLEGRWGAVREFALNNRFRVVKGVHVLSDNWNPAELLCAQAMASVLKERRVDHPIK